MKVFSWVAGRVTAGVEVRADERLGQVLFLGEEGRGRRYEKVALGKRNPAEVINGRVFEAHPVKITLPAKEEKPEKAFYVLEKPNANDDGAVLVRISTLTSYIRGASGRYVTVEGKPETLIAGYGAFGDAGRVGGWDDGLVVMRLGDVLRVYPSRGDSYALWLGADMTPVTSTWKDYENILILAVEAGKPEGLDVAFATMPAFTWQSGKLEPGLCVVKGATGSVVAVGESGRGRSLIEVPLVGIDTTKQNDHYGRESEVVETASVVKLDEKLAPARYSWDKPTIKTIYGLTSSDRREEGAFLVRVNARGGYARRGSGSVEAWKGTPTLLASGHGADGDAGRIGNWDDGLWVLREGDVLRARASGGNPSFALYAGNGEIRTRRWVEWKLADAVRDPAFYVGKGTAPWGHTPAEWIGKVVTLQDKEMGDLETGELVSVNPFVLNLGWDAKDYTPKTITYATWVVVEEGKQVCRLEGKAAEKRKQLRAEADELREHSRVVVAESYFSLTEADLRREVEDLSCTEGFDTMPTEGWYDSLTAWVEKAKGVLERFAAAESELKTLEQRQDSGEVLVDFGGHFRVMGATGQAQYWVIRPDGSCREPDEVNYRKRYTSEGNKTWRTVEPEELAISWSKAFTAAEHEFVVNKIPVSGCTQAQLDTVRALHAEIAGEWEGAVGMSGTESPAAQGWWQLFSDGQVPTPNVVEEESQTPSVPASTDALEALRQKWGSK